MTTNWPVLTTYQGDHLREVAFPLGGIGTGSIALGGRAEFRDFEIFKNAGSRAAANAPCRAGGSLSLCPLHP
jgi:uncharacterized protein (DUF608 family)